MGDEFTFDLVPEGASNSFHMPNLPGEDFRRIVARTPNESSPLSMRIKLVEVHHGKMIYEEEDSEATLLVFEFRFQSRQQDRRYQMTSVTLEFFDKGGIAQKDPHVVDLAPDRMHWLNKTTRNRTTKYGASLGVKGGVELAGGEANVHWDVEQEKPLKFKATLTGIAGYSNRKTGTENAVTWSMHENTDEGDGIPSLLQTAVLLKRSHSGPFFATLRVKSAVDVVSAALRALPLTTDKDKIIDSVTFTPGKVQVRNSSVTKIREHDLQHMERLPISSYFSVNLSEEDPLTPAVPTAAAPAAVSLTQPTSSGAAAPAQEPGPAPAQASQQALPPAMATALAQAMAAAAMASAAAARAAAAAAEAAAAAADAARAVLEAASMGMGETVMDGDRLA